MEKNKYILFIGDSFTWGQGLYLPYWVDRKKYAFLEMGKSDIQWIDHQKYLDEKDLEIKDKLSFTGLVSSELNRICVKKIDNGGDNLTNLSILKSEKRFVSVNNKEEEFTFADKDIILIFQFTSFSREDMFMYINDEEKDIILESDINKTSYLINLYFKNKIKLYFESIDAQIEDISTQYGFQYWYLDWLGDYWEFRPDKFIDIKLGSKIGKYFGPLVDLMPIEVKFDGKYIRDGHLNEEANKVMAQSIIEWLRDKSRGVGG